MDLTSRVALITGAASGIGLGIAKRLLENGIKGVVIVDINPRGKEIAEDLSTKHGDGKVIFLKADVSDKSELKSAFQRTVDNFGCLDLVFNHAGVLNEHDAEGTYKVNVIGATNCAKLAMDEFLNNKSADEGILINTASIVALDPQKWCANPVYVASKCAILGLSQSLSNEFHYRRTGVKVVAICPGVTITPIISLHTSEHPEEAERMRTELPRQQVEDLTSHIIPILDEAENGSIWRLEDRKRELVSIPKIC